jgi:predicted permease
VYLAKVNIKEQSFKLSASISFVKLLLLPIFGIVIIVLSGIDSSVGSILMLSLLVPLAVNNVNIAALYNCKPYAVTTVVLVSTLLFLVVLFPALELIKLILGDFNIVGN